MDILHKFMRLWKQPSRSITYTYYTFAFAFMEFCYSMILYFWYSLGKTKRLGGLLSYIMKSRILYFCYFSCLNMYLCSHFGHHLIICTSLNCVGPYNDLYYLYMPSFSLPYHSRRLSLIFALFLLLCRSCKYIKTLGQ